MVAPRDVVVAGASLTGLYCAHLLAQRGRRVTVFERGKALDPSRRTLIVTGRVRDYLDGIEPASVVNEIRRFELFADGKVASIPLGMPDLVVERAALMRELAGKAEQSGAAIEFGWRAEGVSGEPGGLRVALSGTRRTSIVARTAIGADGVGSRIAAAAGWKPQATASLLQALIALPQDVSPDTTRVWFRPQDTPYFYWLIPHSSEIAVVGLIGRDPRTVRSCLDSFLHEKRWRPLQYQAARVPVGARWRRASRRVGDGMVYLVGDAAGHVKVSTVGGVVTGFRGARGVVDAILTGAPNGELRRLNRELETHRLLRRVLRGFSQDDYVRLLSLIDDELLSSLATTNRDEAGRLVWAVCRVQPSLVSLGLRALLLGR